MLFFHCSRLKVWSWKRSIANFGVPGHSLAQESQIETYRPISQRKMLVYNGGILILTTATHKKHYEYGSNFARP